MQGNTAHEFARLWSQLTHMHLDMHGVVPHLHDAGLSALAAAIIMLGVVILLELRSVARMRQAMDRSLERVFEQLDLLRFDTQLLEERWQSKAVVVASAVPKIHPAAAGEPPVVTPKAAAAATIAVRAPVAISAPARELPESRSLSSGEARLLSSLAEARARRAAAAG